MVRSRALEPSPIALIGGVLAIVSSFLAWDDMVDVAYDDSFKVPIEFLWDEDASGGFKLGVPLVIVAAVVALFSVSASAPVVFLRRLGGLLLLAAVALFVVQLGRRVGWDNLEVGVGPYLAGAGGLVALLAPSGLWPFRRGSTATGAGATGGGRRASASASDRRSAGRNARGLVLRPRGPGSALLGRQELDRAPGGVETPDSRLARASRSAKETAGIRPEYRVYAKATPSSRVA